MATKREILTFFKKLHKLMQDLHAVDNGKKHYRYTLETKAGPLDIDFWETDLDNKPRRKFIYAVYMRFDDPTRANALLGNDLRLNHYSGKWNRHEYDGTQLVECLEVELRRILPDPVPAS